MIVLALPAFAAAQTGRSSAPALRGGGNNGTSPEVSSLAATQSYDPCHIHKGCDSTPGYSQTGSMGPGWYCSDGMYVDGSTKYDQCRIHSNCQSGAKWDGSMWVCSDDNPGVVFDKCYIHQNCQAGAAYSNDGTASLGNGWYCNDGQWVDANTHFDACHIHKECSCGVSFKFHSWVCNC